MLTLPSPTPIPEQIKVKIENQLAESGALGNYLLSVRCPKGYGIRNIRCNPSLGSQATLSSVAQNIPDIDSFGGYCSYKANFGFKGTIEATCDRRLFNIPVFNVKNFLPGENSQMPDSLRFGTREKRKKSKGISMISSFRVRKVPEYWLKVVG